MSANESRGGIERPLQPGWQRVGVQATLDAAAWIASVLLATFLRYEGFPAGDGFEQALALGAVAAISQVIIGYTLRLYRGRYRFGSFDEVVGVTITAAAVTVIAFVYRATAQTPDQSRSVPLIAGVLALMLMLSLRFILRAYRTRWSHPKSGERTLVYGAGDSGARLLEQMLRDSNGEFTPVGFIDDDPLKRHLRIASQRVLGNNADLEEIMAVTRAQVVVVAIANVEANFLLDLDRRCQRLGASLRVIPTTSEIIGGAVTLGDISSVTEEDLLGRRPVTIDEGGIASLINDKRVLVTGAGGSIGSELARQLHRYHPYRVYLLDRDESGLHATQLSIDGQGLLDSEELVLADIRDAQRMHEVMQHLKPDIVFHAAALKHLPLLQRYPEEGRKTNIEGTRNVLEAARAVGVSTFVNISTDKAADPTSVLGETKRQTELITAAMPTELAPHGKCRYLSVRFGNVLGSRGSFITTFRHQIANGGPVTVTHPEVTRYFMTVPEAVQLVLQAALVGEHGEILILDMGEPINIADVARYMIDKSGRRIEIVFTGLRPGEKLNEVLLSQDELQEARRHPLISHTRALSSRAESHDSTT